MKLLDHQVRFGQRIKVRDGLWTDLKLPYMRKILEETRDCVEDRVQPQIVHTLRINFGK